MFYLRGFIQLYVCGDIIGLWIAQTNVSVAVVILLGWVNPFLDYGVMLLYFISFRNVFEQDNFLARGPPYLIIHNGWHR
jgi:hypothetical protein